MIRSFMMFLKFLSFNEKGFELGLELGLGLVLGGTTLLPFRRALRSAKYRTREELSEEPETLLTNRLLIHRLPRCTLDRPAHLDLRRLYQLIPSSLTNRRRSRDALAPATERSSRRASGWARDRVRDPRPRILSPRLASGVGLGSPAVGRTRTPLDRAVTRLGHRRTARRESRCWPAARVTSGGA